MSKFRRTLRACLSLFRIRFAQGLQYRAAALANASIALFWALLEILVYSVFYTHGNYRQNTPMTLGQVISYVWLAQAMLSFANISLDGELRGKITSGDVALELCRPLDFYWHWFAKTMAGRQGDYALRALLTLLVGLLMPAALRLSGPASLGGFLLFWLSIISAFLLCGAYTMLMAAMRLGITWGDGPTNMLMLLASIMSGAFLPLQLWPDVIQKALLLQPFAGMIDIPLRLYLGTMPIDQAMPAIGLQLIWTAVFILAGRLLTRKRLADIIVQGG